MMEIMIAVAVMIMGISAAAAMMLATESSAEEMIRESQAIALAEEGIQASVSINDRDWSELAVGTHGLAIQSSPVRWIFQGTSDVSGGFTRTVAVSSVDAHTKKISVIVTWHPRPDRTATIEEQALFTDWAFL